MGTRVLTYLIALVLFASASKTSPHGEHLLPPMDFQHWAILDQMGHFHMLWTPGEKDIVMEIQVATRGYVGLGFSPNGGMKGADILLGWVDDQGTVHAHDRYAVGMMTPLIDDSQDVEVIGGYENDTHTVLRFSRPWNSCDKEHDFKLSGDTTRVIWAYSDEDPVAEHVMKKHTHRGTKSIYLQEPRFSLPQFGDDVWNWEVRMNNVSVPGEIDTYYMCQIIKAPPLQSKTHVIGYVPIFQEENREHVHHMLLYECHVPESSNHFEHWIGVEGYQCFSPNMPISWANCRSPIIAWAIGSEGDMFPDHVGFPLGEEHGGATYFMIEIHYDNPNFRQGIVDESGLRLFLTEKVREFEAGLFVLGHEIEATPIVPPGRYWKTVSHCDSECFRQDMPPEGVKVFQGVLHAHLLGRDITVRQLRAGRELPIVFKDMNYDFNYQQTRVLEEEMSILPGDAFIIECGYDASQRRTPTFGGESTQEEMCQALLMYYPRIKVSRCVSSPELSQIYTSFGIQEVYSESNSVLSTRKEQFTDNVEKNGHNDAAEKPMTFDFSKMYKNYVAKEPKEMMNVSLYEVIHDPKTWQDNEVVSKLQGQTAYGPHKVVCTDVRQNSYPGYPRTYYYPDFLDIKYLDEECDISHEGEAYESEVISGQGGPKETPQKTEDSKETSGSAVSQFSSVLVIVCLSVLALGRK